MWKRVDEPPEPERLLEELRRNPDADASHPLLRRLLTSFKDHPATLAASSLVLGCGDVDAALELCTALAGEPRRLPQLAAEPRYPEPIRCVALTALLGDAVPERHLELCLRLAQDSHEALADLAARSLRALDRRVDVEQVRRWLAQQAAAPDGDLELSLLRLLDDADPRVQASATWTLGALGSLRALPRLERGAREAETSTARARCRRAADAVRARHTAAPAGSLSVSDDAEGRLSRDESGGLSEPDPSDA